jgi:hypothetical protein
MPYELLPTRRRSLLSELSPEDDEQSLMFSDPRRWGGQGFDPADMELKRNVVPIPLATPQAQTPEDPLWPKLAEPTPGPGLRSFPPKPYMNTATMFASQQDRSPTGMMDGPGIVTRMQRKQTPELPGYEDLGFKGESLTPTSIGIPAQSGGDGSPMVARGGMSRAPSLLDVLPAGDAPTEPALPDMPVWAARQAMQGDQSRAPIPGNAARIIAGLDAEKNAKMETMQGQMAQRGNAMLGAIRPGMGMAESGAASEAALQDMKAQQQIAGGMPWWQAQGNQTTFYSGNKPSTSNDEFLAQFGGGFKPSGRGPGGGANEQVMPAAKPLTLIDALAPGESKVVKDQMGRVQWAKNDKALPRDPNEPKWSPGLNPANGPNSPEAMGRYEAAMAAQRQRQQERGFDPNMNNGANTGLAQARALARNGMNPNAALATARENVGNPIQTNSLLAGVMMGPELLQEQARAEAVVKAAEFRTKEITAQMEAATAAGNNQLAENLAREKNRTDLLLQQGQERLETMRAGIAAQAAATALQGQQLQANTDLAKQRFEEEKRARQVEEGRFQPPAPQPGTLEGVQQGVKLAATDPTAPAQQAIPAQARLLNTGEELPADSQIYRQLLNDWENDVYDNGRNAWNPMNWLGKGGSTYESDAQVFAEHAKRAYGLEPDVAKKFYMKTIAPLW